LAAIEKAAKEELAGRREAAMRAHRRRLHVVKRPPRGPKGDDPKPS
jgi:hypothetical protein